MHFLRVVRCSLVKHCLAALRSLKNFVASYCSSYHPFFIQDHIIRTNPAMSEDSSVFDLTKVKNGEVLPYCKKGALLWLFGSSWREFLHEARCNIRSRPVQPGDNPGHVLYPLEIESKGVKDLEFPVDNGLRDRLAEIKGGDSATLRFIRPQMARVDINWEAFIEADWAFEDAQHHFQAALNHFERSFEYPSLTGTTQDPVQVTEPTNAKVKLYSDTSNRSYIHTLGQPPSKGLINWFGSLVQNSMRITGGPPAMVVMETDDDKRKLKLFAEDTIAGAKTRPVSPSAPRAEKSDPPIDADPPKEPSPKDTAPNTQPLDAPASEATEANKTKESGPPVETNPPKQPGPRDTAPNTQLPHATAPGAVEANKARTEEKQHVVLETVEENTTSVEPENPQQPPNPERRNSELLTRKQELDLRSKQLEDWQKRLERREQEVEEREQKVEQREQKVGQREQEASAAEEDFMIRYERLEKVEGEVRETVQVVAKDKEDIRRRKNKNQRKTKRLNDADKRGHLQKDSQQVSSEASDDAAETRDIYEKNIEDERESHNEVLTWERERHTLDSEDKDRTILRQRERIAEQDVHLRAQAKEIAEQEEDLRTQAEVSTEQGEDLRIQTEEITKLTNERDALQDELNERQPQSEQTRPEPKRTQPGRKSKAKPKAKAEAGEEGPDKYFYCDRCMKYLRTEEVSLTTLPPFPSTIFPTSLPLSPLSPLSPNPNTNPPPPQQEQTAHAPECKTTPAAYLYLTRGEATKERNARKKNASTIKQPSPASPSSLPQNPVRETRATTRAREQSQLRKRKTPDASPEEVEEAAAEESARSKRARSETGKAKAADKKKAADKQAKKQGGKKKGGKAQPPADRPMTTRHQGREENAEAASVEVVEVRQMTTRSQVKRENAAAAKAGEAAKKRK